MEALVAILLVVAFIYFIAKPARERSKATANDANQQPTKTLDSPPISSQAIDALTRVTSICQEYGGDGFDSLIVAASSDGKVSRDELRIIMWYCESCGAKFSPADADYVSSLNSGITIRVNSNSRTPSDIVSECDKLDVSTLTKLHSAHVSIGKPWNKSSSRHRDTLAALEQMISHKAATAITNNELAEQA